MLFCCIRRNVELSTRKAFVCTTEIQPFYEENKIKQQIKSKLKIQTKVEKIIQNQTCVSSSIFFKNTIINIKSFCWINTKRKKQSVFKKIKKQKTKNKKFFFFENKNKMYAIEEPVDAWLRLKWQFVIWINFIHLCKIAKTKHTMQVRKQRTLNINFN